MDAPLLEYVPPTHAVQLREPAAENVPPPQLSQLEAPAPEYLPPSEQNREHGLDVRWLLTHEIVWQNDGPDKCTLTAVGAGRG